MRILWQPRLPSYELVARLPVKALYGNEGIDASDQSLENVLLSYFQVGLNFSKLSLSTIALMGYNAP